MKKKKKNIQETNKQKTNKINRKNINENKLYQGFRPPCPTQTVSRI